MQSLGKLRYTYIYIYIYIYIGSDIEFMYMDIGKSRRLKLFLESKCILGKWRAFYGKYEEASLCSLSCE